MKKPKCPDCDEKLDKDGKCKECGKQVIRKDKFVGDDEEAAAIIKAMGG